MVQLLGEDILDQIRSVFHLKPEQDLDGLIWFNFLVHGETEAVCSHFAALVRNLIYINYRGGGL